MKALITLFLVAFALPAYAQAGTEHWVATSSTAMAITGDIVLSPTRISMAGKTLPLRVVADVPAFQTANDGVIGARVLQIVKPAAPVLLNGNRLCRATWIAVWRTHAFGQTNLDMAVYSGSTMPKAEDELGLCGTYMYSKPGA